MQHAADSLEELDIVHAFDDRQDWPDGVGTFDHGEVSRPPLQTAIYDRPART
jgi:hypothetical protein